MPSPRSEFEELEVVGRGDMEIELLAQALEFAATALRSGRAVNSSAKFVSAPILSVEVRSTGPRGGDASHGGEASVTLRVDTGVFEFRAK